MVSEFIDTNRELKASYFRDYVGVAFGEFVPTSPKINFGDSDKSLRVCRYCLNRQPEVSFRKTAHGFPFLIGNRTLIDRLECDSCNALFSETIEHNFSQYINPLRTIGRIAGRSGVPTYKAQDGSFRIDAELDLISMQVGEGSIESVVDYESKLMTLKMVRPAYSPILVYKMFVKMALAVMPHYYIDELAGYRRWLLKRGDELEYSPAILHEWRLSGPLPPQRIKYALYRAKSGNASLVRYVFTILFGNYQYQIALPIADGKRHLQQTIHLHPVMLSDNHLKTYGASALEVHDMAIRGIRTGEPVIQHIQFKGYEETPPTDIEKPTPLS